MAYSFGRGIGLCSNSNRKTYLWSTQATSNAGQTHRVGIIIFGEIITFRTTVLYFSKEILKCLSIIHFSLEGCAILLPFFEGKELSIIPMVTPNVQFKMPCMPADVKSNFFPRKILKAIFSFIEFTAPDGSNFRNAIFGEIKKLAEYLLKDRENDTKSMLKLVAILRILLQSNGIDEVIFIKYFFSKITNNNLELVQWATFDLSIDEKNSCRSN